MRFVKTSFVLLLAIQFGVAFGQSADEWVKQASAAETRMDPIAALDLFKRADAERPNDPFILQKISRQCSDATVVTPDTDNRRRLSEEALVYSKRAYQLEPKNPVYALSMAICYGKLGLYGSTEAKVENARLIKKYADEALALKPDYDWAHHVLGRWNYEVAALGGTKQFFAKLLYGGLPKASYEEAISHLQRAVELSPKVVAHHVELGFAYLAAKRPADARREFELGLSLPTVEIHDQSAKLRAQEALKQLK